MTTQNTTGLLLVGATYRLGVSVSRCSVQIVYGITLFAVITQWPLQTRGCLFIKELYFTRNKTSHILTSYNYNLQTQLTICSS